jgi:hypothetical protein
MTTSEEVPLVKTYGLFWGWIRFRLLSGELLQGNLGRQDLGCRFMQSVYICGKRNICNFSSGERPFSIIRLSNRAKRWHSLCYEGKEIKNGI